MLTSCYAARLFLLAAAMYVDGTDLFHWGNSPITRDYLMLHFGHYKAATFSEGPSRLHTAKLKLCAKTGVALDIWGIGLTVLLENNCGNNFVHKLRAIYLY